MTVVQREAVVDGEGSAAAEIEGVGGAVDGGGIDADVGAVAAAAAVTMPHVAQPGEMEAAC